MKTFARSAFMLSVVAVIVVCAMQRPTMAQDKTVWMVCTWDTSSIWNGKDSKQKFERRLYVSPLVSMTTEAYLTQDSTGNRLEGLCGDYLDQTVVQAATARGEKLDPSGQLTIIRNIELSGEDAGGPNPYSYATKQSIEQKRDGSIKDGKDAGRVIYFFNWDPTGGSLAEDKANEGKRTGPNLGPAMPPPPPPKPTGRGKGAR